MVESKSRSKMVSEAGRFGRWIKMRNEVMTGNQGRFRFIFRICTVCLADVALEFSERVCKCIF